MSQLGSSVTVITREDIERKQERTLPDLLRDVPGLNVVQTGGAGGITSVFIRGANSNHTKVLVDGIDVSDPTSFNNAFDFAHLLTSDVERVEILRGPQSGLYGSDAIGGVIDIRTKKGAGPARITGTVEGGSFGTFNQAGGVSGSSGAFNYSFNTAHYSVNGTPVTPLELLPPGRARNNDSYDNLTYSARVGVDLSRNFDVGVTARYVESTLKFTGDEFDLNTFTFVPSAKQSESNTEQWFTRAYAHYVMFNGAFDQTLGVGYTDYKRRDVTPGSDPAFNNGDRVKYDWTGVVKLAPSQTLTVGAEHQVDRIVDSPISAETKNDAGFVQLQSKFGERFFNVASVRYDDNDRFGDVTTYRVAPAFLIPETGTKLKASYGTGYKAPSLNQLFVSFPAFNFFANPDLKPETSVGYDFGFEQSLLANRVQFGVIYFHNDIKNLIAANETFTTNININRATIYGVESFVAFRPLKDVTLRADYTFTLADDAATDRELLRRPKHKTSLNAAWQATEKLLLSATFIHVGSFADGNRDFSIPRLKADEYSIVNIAGAYDLGGGLTAFGRVDNLFDEKYQDPTGYLRPGLGAYAGLKVDVGAADLARGLE